MTTIAAIHAREILDSRGYPTVEVDAVLSDGARGRASVPAGTSVATGEAVELRDGETRFAGKGVKKAVEIVSACIQKALVGHNAFDQASLDATMCVLDGTSDKSRLGANAILGVSLAVARAAATSKQEPLYRYLGGSDARLLPVPMFNLVNGGVNADNNLDLQEFMIAPVGASSFSEAVCMGADVFHALKAILRRKGYRTEVVDEGGFAPNLRGNIEAVELILEAIMDAGFHAGSDIVLALDPAASEFFERGSYVFRKSDGSQRTSVQMVQFWENWVRQYPIRSIEDGVARNDELGWRGLTKALGHKVQLVGDDNMMTNASLIRKACFDGIANAALIKPNQIGTVTETFAAIKEAHAAAYGTIISHRSGDTNDDFIADLAVATGAAQIKSGAPCRGERIAKYNQLMRIEEELGASATYAGRQSGTKCLTQRNHPAMSSGQVLLTNGVGLLRSTCDHASG